MKIPVVSNISFIRSKPVNLKPSDDWLFSNFYTRRFSGIYVHQRRNVYVNYDRILWQGIHIIRQSLYRREKLFRNAWEKFKFCIRERLTKKTTHIPAALVITDAWSHNYFHWLVDVLQRYEIAGEKGYHSFPILLPVHFSNISFITNSLQRLGISAVFISPEQICKVKTCVYVDHFFPPGAVHDTYIKRIKTNILSRIASDIPTSGTRIYVSRKTGGRRNIVNETAVRTVLDDYGFQTIYPEELAFEDQVKTFAGASLVVGQHGAGLTNILFMQAGTLIELRMQGSVNQWCYFELASALNADYYYLLNDPEHPDADPHEGNIVVNTNLLKDLLETILQKK